MAAVASTAVVAVADPGTSRIEQARARIMRNRSVGRLRTPEALEGIDNPVVLHVGHELAWWAQLGMLRTDQLEATIGEIIDIVKSTQPQWSFQDLLCRGRQRLEEHIDDVAESERTPGDTGITFDTGSHEACQFAREMVAINRFMYTTASTNYPEDPKFQAMFVSGFMPLTHALAILPRLQAVGVFYVLTHTYSFTRLAEFHHDLGRETCVATLIGMEQDLPKELLCHLGRLMFDPSDPLVHLHIEATPDNDDRSLYRTVLALLQDADEDAHVAPSAPCP